MIKPEQIPLEVIAAAWDGLGANDDMRSAIAAALNAWETPMHRAIVGKALDEVGSMYPALILPLTQEPRT
jgi:hypothetical protein